MKTAGGCSVLIFVIVLGLGTPAGGGVVGYLSDASIVSWGQNTGLPPTGYDFRQITAGDGCNLALRSDGSLVAWGITALVPAPGGTGFTSIAASRYHALACRPDGSMTAWGSNTYGESNPHPPAVQVAAGWFHSVALKGDGTLYAWGSNGFGQINVPTGTFLKVDAEELHNLAIRSDGTLAAWGDSGGGGGMSIVPGGNDFVGIAAGGQHNLALRSNGTLAAWGANNVGQCTLPGGSNFVQVAAGTWYSLALRSDGTIVAWGRNDFHQAEPPPVPGFYTAVAAGSIHDLALRARDVYEDLAVSGTGSDALLQRPITVSGNATISSMMTLANNPTMTVLGQTTITPAGGVQGHGTIVGAVNNQGVIAAGGPGGDITFRGPVTGPGSYHGSVIFDGGFSPGASPSTVTLDMATFTANNVLTMEIGGPSPNLWDRLIANQVFFLGGMLDIDLIYGFQPQPGQQFDLFDGPMSGTFATVSLPGLNPGAVWNTSRLYSDGLLRVEGQSTPGGPVPVPAALPLTALGVGLVALARRRRK